MPANLENSKGHRTGKGQFSFQVQRKVVSKNVQTNIKFILISHASKVMLKILQARIQQYMSQELPDVQTGFRKVRRTRDLTANIHWIIEKVRGLEKSIYFFVDYVKAFDCVDHNKLWKILKQMGIQDHFTLILRNLYAGQGEIFRTGHGTT